MKLSAIFLLLFFVCGTNSCLNLKKLEIKSEIKLSTMDFVLYDPIYSHTESYDMDNYFDVRDSLNIFRSFHRNLLHQIGKNQNEVKKIRSFDYKAVANYLFDLLRKNQQDSVRYFISEKKLFDDSNFVMIRSRFNADIDYGTPRTPTTVHPFYHMDILVVRNFQLVYYRPVRYHRISLGNHFNDRKNKKAVSFLLKDIL